MNSPILEACFETDFHSNFHNHVSQIDSIHQAQSRCASVYQKHIFQELDGVSVAVEGVEVDYQEFDEDLHINFIPYNQVDVPLHGLNGQALPREEWHIFEISLH